VRPAYAHREGGRYRVRWLGQSVVVPTKADADQLLAEIAAGQGPKVQPRQRLSTYRLTDEEIKAGIELSDVDHGNRPKTRGECGELGRTKPCPWVTCKYHLAVDITHAGAIKQYGDPLEMEETCALTVAEQGGVTLQQIATWWGMERERVRQIEARALETARKTIDGDVVWT
jgi:hypothetical protein